MSNTETQTTSMGKLKIGGRYQLLTIGQVLLWIASRTLDISRFFIWLSDGPRYIADKIMEKEIKIRSDKGFTFIELLVVIAVICMLISFILTAYRNHIESNQTKEKPAITEKYKEKGKKHLGEYE